MLDMGICMFALNSLNLKEKDMFKQVVLLCLFQCLYNPDITQ